MTKEYEEMISSIQSFTKSLDKKLRQLNVSKITLGEFGEICESVDLFKKQGDEICKKLTEAKIKVATVGEMRTRAIELIDGLKEEMDKGFATLWNVPMLAFGGLVLENPSYIKYKPLMKSLFVGLYDEVLLDIIKGDINIGVLKYAEADKFQYDEDEVLKILKKVLEVSKQYLTK